jgi:hypothetical protein
MSPAVASSFRAFFHVHIFVGRRAETDLFEIISFRGQAEPKNARKYPCLLAPLPSSEAIFLRPGHGVNTNLLRRGAAFKGTIRQISKVLAAFSLGLI